MEQKWNLEELKEVKDDYFELVEKLHENIDHLSSKLKEELWDMLYKRFEP